MNSRGYMDGLVKFSGGYKRNCVFFYRGKGSKKTPWVAEYILAESGDVSKEFRTLRDAVRHIDNLGNKNGA